MTPSRRDLAIVAAALLLPIPLLAAGGLVVPLPSAVERSLVSLLPGGEVETGPGGDLPVSIPSRSTGAGAPADGGGGRSSAGIRAGGGDPAAAGTGAAGSDDSAAENVLPRNGRTLPERDEPELPAAPDTSGDPTRTEGTVAPPADPERRSASKDDDPAPTRVSASPRGVKADTPAATVDVSRQEGITLTVDTGVDEDGTTDDATLVVPLPLPTLPLP